jgi:inhibitor of KinA
MKFGVASLHKLWSEYGMILDRTKWTDIGAKDGWIMQEKHVKFEQISETALCLIWGNVIDVQVHRQIQAVMKALDALKPSWLVECVPAFSTLLVIYNPAEMGKRRNAAAYVQDYLQEVLRTIHNMPEPGARHVTIPVCYGDEFGPDLEQVALENGLSPDHVVEIHAGAEYLVYMIGFAPGFPYLGGLDSRIWTPRRTSPRQHVPARSVGIAGEQTGIYPLSTPGGWQLIGRTPLQLFRPLNAEPSLLAAGDIVTFMPISRAEYETLLEEQSREE